MGLEGAVASVYFQALTDVLPFEGRSPTARDHVNICLNYAYGILYSQVEKACLLAGLDPYLGFYHCDRYGKPSMVLDLVEEFRAVVADRAVVTLFGRNEISGRHFETEGAKWLNKEGRKKVLSEVLGRLTTKITFEKRKVPYEAVILDQARKVASFLLDDIPSYKPYIHRW